MQYDGTRVGDTPPLLCVLIDPSQRDEEERISGDTADASDVDDAAKDAGSREAEKADTAVHAGAEEQALSGEQDASSAEVRGCLLLLSLSLSLFPGRTAFDICCSWCVHHLRATCVPDAALVGGLAGCAYGTCIGVVISLAANYVTGAFFDPAC